MNAKCVFTREIHLLSHVSSFDKLLAPLVSRKLLLSKMARGRPLVGSPPSVSPLVGMGGRKRSEEAANIGEAADGARESDVRGRRSRGGRAGNCSDLGSHEPTTTSQAAGSMPPPGAGADGPGSTAPRSSGPGSGIASTVPAYAKLQRLSTDVPATPSLPDEISLPEPGSLSSLTVGRHAHKNDVMLDCKLVPSLLSRQHAEIHCDTEGVHYLMDKNTLNGTYLNGNLIPTGPVPLKDGDIIAFGGPTNVLRDNTTLKNSFRFIYRCPKNVEQWRAAVRACADAEAAANATPTAEAWDAAPPSKRARVGDGAGPPETASGARASDAMPPPPTNAATPRVAPDPAADMGLAPEGYRSAGRPVAKLSRRDWVTTRRVASKMESRSVDFLSQALSEVGAALGESVIPLNGNDENVLQGIITDHGELFSNTREALSMSGVASPNALSDADMTVMTQATQEYACISPTKGLDSDASAADFIRRACRDALKLHFSPGGVVTFSLKLLDAHGVWNSEVFLAKEQRDKSARFKRGDLVAEAAALALWPLYQLGWDDAGDTSKETVGVAAQKKYGPETTTTGFTLNDCVFAASVSEIDGRGCDVGPEGCAALAESALAPRQKTDGVWVYNQSLLGLSLADNPRIGDQGCAAIATTLQPKPCANGSRTRQFTTIFNTTLTTLDLSGCGIGPKGAGALVGALRPVSNDNGDRCFPSGLRTLNLSGNCLESEGCRSIARLLGPDKNVQTGKWYFNASLAVLDVSDNPGMDDSVAEAFANALLPKAQKRAKDEKEEKDEKDKKFLVNTALLELNLCGHAFSPEGEYVMSKALSAETNGSEGTLATKASVILSRPSPSPSSSSQSKRVVDADGHDYELVLPLVTGCAAERRPLSRAHWRAWRTPTHSTSQNDPSVESGSARGTNVALPWLHQLSEDHDASGSTKPWSTGFALRNTLLQRFEGGDSIVPMDPTTVASAGLPQWLDDELRCVICTDIFINPYAVNGCGHVFCHECVSHWLTTQSSQCPICRHRLSLPISLALTPCVMAQGLLDHYVLPYLPPEDVEARRERAREVRNKAAKRAADARRPPTSFPGSPGGGAMGGVAAATAALAHVFSRGSGISSIRVSGAANVNAIQRLLEAHGRRVTRIGAGARSNQAQEPTGGGTGVPADGSDLEDPMEDMVNTLRSTSELLRGLQDSRRRREEQLAEFRRQAREAEAGLAAFQDRLADPQRELSREQGVTTAGASQSRGTDDRARVTWTAVSSEVNFATPCAHCAGSIPPCFLRLRRSEKSVSIELSQVLDSESDAEVTDYFHPNISCLTYYRHELRGMLAVEGLADLTDQEQRVVRALRSGLTQETSQRA